MLQSGKTIALLMAVVITMFSTVLTTGAFTVEKDGREYTFFSHTPTTGNYNVLAIRVGFTDYPADGAEYPADSEENLLSYFDGSEGSVSAYYETASYGKLHLSCDVVFTCDMPRSRNECSANQLLEEALGELEAEIDFERYDSDGDGYLDFVVLDFAGPFTGWATEWWPCVRNADISDIGGKSVDRYTLIRGSAEVFTHEFGHILGAPDYYSYNDGNTNAIMTYDMMSVNTGDHDGFTKWYYGWLSDDDIAFVDRSSGDTTVTLAPIETPLGDGKKIAAVAPSIDHSLGFMNEFFIVEYDSGVFNNADAFEAYSLEPGFRIFHVRGETVFSDEESEVHFNHNNNMVRNNLIHSIKNELLDPEWWNTYDYFFREGDELTPNGYPNTGFAVDEVYNGLFTGISFTDFVTGENPSFKVSFADSHEQNDNVNFSLSCDRLGAKMEMTLTADKPTVNRDISLPENQKYTPYLIDAEGNKLFLDVESADNSAYSYSLTYTRAYPTAKPETEYTLVIPQGLFITGYYQDVPAYRTSVKTPLFLALTVIAENPPIADRDPSTNLFSVTDNSFGVIRVPYSGKGECTFVEYNLNGDEIGNTAFELPRLNPTDNPRNDGIYYCSAYRLSDGNFALELKLNTHCCYVKINRRGEILSDVYAVEWELLSDYSDSFNVVDYNLYKNGICKTLGDVDNGFAQLNVDFENEPELTKIDGSYRYFFLDGDTYAMMVYGDDRELILFDQDDRQLGAIPMDHYLLSVFAQDDNVMVLYSDFDAEADTTFVYADTYSKSCELLGHEDITEQAQHISEYTVWNRAHVNDSGYYFEYSAEFRDEPSLIIAYDKDWNYLGVLEFDEGSQYTIADVCGVRLDYQYSNGDMMKVISRFSIGDFDIVTGDRLLGDANLDQEVSVTDATIVQRFDARMLVLNDTAQRLADVDRDGDVCVIDATWIQRYEAGMKAPEGIGKSIS